MATWTIDWQRGSQTLTLPDDNLEVIEKPDLPKLGSWVELVAKAIDEPIGCPPIEQQVKPGDRVALLVSDTQDHVFGQDGVGLYLLNRLNRAGIPDRDITVVHGAGMHGHARGRQKVGEAIISRVTYVEHDPYDSKEHRYVGHTRAGTPVWVNRHVAEVDFVMGVGHCGPSLYGFQGGAGIILPGVSANDTVRHNHSKIITDRTSSCWGPGNPMREDVMDAGDLAKLRFKIDFTGNTVFAGYFRREWPIAVEYAQRHVMVQVEPADLYVFAPPSQQRLMALYMSIESAERVTKPDGVVIAVIGASGHEPLSGRPLEETMREFAYCTEQWCKATGDDNPLHGHWRQRDEVCKAELLSMPLEEISRVVTRRLGEPRSTTHVWSHRRCIDARYTILVSEGVSREEGNRMGFKYVTDSTDDAVEHALKRLGPNPHIVANVGTKSAIPIIESEFIDSGLTAEAASVA